MNKKIILIGSAIMLFITMGMVAAESNMTVETYGEISSEITIDNGYDNGIVQEDALGQGYDPENFQPRIIPQEYSYRQNIPDDINYSTDYDDYYGYYISIVDEYGDNIPYLEARLVDADTNEEQMTFAYEEDEDAYWCCVSLMGVGNHSCKIIVDDYYYDIKPLYFNLEIVKSDVELVLKEIYAVKGDYATIKANVRDMEGSPIIADGKVKFTVDGKDYYRNVDENGIATLNVKMNKKGTISYSATYLGGEEHNPTNTKKSKVRVLGTDKSSRTIKIKGYKVVIPLDKYKKLIKAKYTGKTYVFKLNTGKTIKQKVDIYNKKTWKKTTKTVKSKIYIYICYDGADEYIGSLPGNQYVAELTTSSQTRASDIVCHKWLSGYKQSREFVKLNSAKVKQKLINL